MFGDLANVIVLVLLHISGTGALDSWKLHEHPTVPDDVMRLGALDDPLAQARLWQAIYPEVPRGFLVEKCVLESGGCSRAQSTHRGDARFGEQIYRGVWDRGKLDPTCARYPAPDTVDAQWFDGASTRGNFGLMAAYNVQHLGDCVPFEALDLPFFSAWAAAVKATKACRRYVKLRKRPCSTQALHCHWAQKRYGSSACGRVIRKQRARLKRYQAQLDLDFSYNPTLAEIRHGRTSRP